MDSFAKSKTDEISRLRESTDVEFLRKELKRTNDIVPCCAAESLWRTNMIGVIQHRILTLETEACK